MVCLGSAMRRLTASWAYSFSPSDSSATTEGCRRRPWRSGTMTTSPLRTAATTEFVVPRSIPRTDMQGRMLPQAGGSLAVVVGRHQAEDDGGADGDADGRQQRHVSPRPARRVV